MLQSPPISESFLQQYIPNTTSDLIQQQVNWMTGKIDEAFNAYKITLEININQTLQNEINKISEYSSPSFKNLAHQAALSTTQNQIQTELHIIRQNNFELNEKFKEIDNVKTWIRDLENSTRDTQLIQQGLATDIKTMKIEIEKIKKSVDSLHEELITISDYYKVLARNFNENKLEIVKKLLDDKKLIWEELQQTQKKINEDIKAKNEIIDKSIKIVNEKISILSARSLDELKLKEKLKNLEHKIEDNFEEKLAQIKIKLKNDIQISLQEDVKEAEIARINNIETTNARIENIEKSLEEKFESLIITNKRLTKEASKVQNEVEQSKLDDLYSKSK